MWNPADAIEEVEITEELVVVAPNRVVAQAVPPEQPAGSPAPVEVAADLLQADDALLQTADSPSAVAQESDFPVATTAPVTSVTSVTTTLRATDSGSETAPRAGMPGVVAVRDGASARPRRGAAQAVLLLAFGLDALLYMLVVPFLPNRAQSLGASPLVISALFAMYAACLFAATPALGWLTDRLGARRVLLLGLVALAAATFAFAYAPGLPLLFVARGAQGVAAAATWTAGLALVAQMTSVTERPAVFSRIIMVNGIGTLVGPPLGGLLYTLSGFSAPFVAVATLVLLDGCGRLVFLPGRRALAVTRPERSRATREQMRQDPEFVFALLVTLAGAALLAMAEPSIPLVLSNRFGVEPVVIGLVFGGVALIFILFQPLVAAVTRWVGADRAVAFGLVMSAGALMLEATSATALQAELGLIHLALGLSLILLPALEVLTRSGQKRSLTFGALFAAYNLAYAGGQLIGPLIAGATITAAGPSQGFAWLSLIPAVLGFMLLWRGMRRRLSTVPHAGGPRVVA